MGFSMAPTLQLYNSISYGTKHRLDGVHNLSIVYLFLSLSLSLPLSLSLSRSLSLFLYRHTNTHYFNSVARSRRASLHERLRPQAKAPSTPKSRPKDPNSILLKLVQEKAFWPK